MKKFITAFILFSLFAFKTVEQNKITIWLIGDSTMAGKEKKAFPETGWGMPFVQFWDSTVTVDNRAKNGRSSKSFMAENLWQPVLDKMKAGDYVFIQFGHNDESKDKGDRYSNPEEFKANLLKYVIDTRVKNGIPVLITPVARRKFDEAGHIKSSHGEYSELVRQVAKANAVPLIDLDTKSQELLQQMGPDASKYLFNYLEAGEHPNYPEGKQDDTHFSELGARKMAEIILSSVRELKLELSNHIVVPAKK